MKRLILTTLILVAAAGGAIPTVSAAEPREKAKEAREDRELARRYRSATRAIDDERWEDAAELFRQLVRDLPGKADRALYWLAYALNKAGRAADALGLLQELHQKYPDSRWNNDADALELEIREGSGETVSPDALPDDDLKLLAINSLLNTDPEKAVAMLEKVLTSKASEDAKERALFVLSQSHSPRAAQVLESVARGKMGSELQEEALHMLGTNSSAGNRQILVDILRQSSSRKTKEAVLEGLMISGDRAAIASVAETDKDAEIRGEAVHLLGALHATAELDRLYRSEQMEDVKEEIIQAMFVAGDAERVGQLARSEPNPELRAEAVRSLGAMGAKRGAAVLLQLWDSETDPEVRESIIDGLFIQGNARAMIELARKEKDHDMQRSIVQKLSVMKNAEARAYLRELGER
jgi:tetratricopeptide (TPR) repeat protein